MAKISAVDLFCGAGGLTYGLEQAGINVKLGIDIDPQCKFALEKNTKARFLQCDIKNLKAETLKKAWGKSKIRLLAGCAPCQPFSTYTQGKSDEKDPRWSLLHSFMRLVKETLPELITMENVGKLVEHKVFNRFLSTLKSQGYEYAWEIVNCREYGIAQSRRRLVLIASRIGKPSFPKPTTIKPSEWKTVRNKIEKLPPIKAGQSYSKDPLHTSAELTEINMRRIKASLPGGTWRDWPKNLVTKCHTKETGKTYPSVYGRMEWDKPAPTMTGQCFGYGNGRFGHPSQNRAISLREAAIFQSFPSSYQFLPKNEQVNMRAIGLMIGNAVPPKLGEAIGLSLVEHVKKAQ